MKKYKKGEVWFVRVNGNKTLNEYEIADITDVTVQLKRPSTNLLSSAIRYMKQDVEFIEKVKK